MKIMNKTHKIPFAFLHHKICTYYYHIPINIGLNSKHTRFSMKDNNCYSYILNINFDKVSMYLSGGSILKGIGRSIKIFKDENKRKENKMCTSDTKKLKEEDKISN